MKIIKYILAVKTNIGTKEEPVWEISEGGKVEIQCTESNLEANEEIAKKEAYNGEYTIEDDGQPEPEAPTEDSVWDELDEAYQRGVDSV